MDFEQLKEKFAPFILQYKIPLLIGFFGIIFIVFGLVSAAKNSQEKNYALEQNAIDEVSNVSKEIVVDVEGAVMKPGVYRLKRSAIIQDALIAAGGMSSDADREKVAKSMNLASKVIDGSKIYIPSVGEVSGLTSSPSTSSGSSTGDSSSNLININSASENELDSLSGVGIVTTAKIIDNRPYSTVEELLSKKIVSRTVFEKIKDKISVN